jgi:hypothetical protein
MTDTKVSEKIEMSIDEAQFFSTVLHLSDSDRLMLAHNTLRRITSEVMRELHNELQTTPDYSKVFQLLEEMVTYGFAEEAHELLTQTGSHIEECNSQLMPFFKLMAESFKGYAIPERWKEIKGSMFKGWRIFLEDFDLKDSNIHILFCLKGNETQNDKDLFTSAIIPYYKLEKFAEGRNEGSSHEIEAGYLEEKEFTIPMALFIEDSMEKLIKAYVYEGGELIIN